MKYRSEGAVTQFLVFLVVFSSGVHQSDIEPLGPVVLKLHAYLGEITLNFISVENV